jgi:hypothetical protein
VQSSGGRSLLRFTGDLPPPETAVRQPTQRLLPFAVTLAWRSAAPLTAISCLLVLLPAILLTAILLSARLPHWYSFAPVVAAPVYCVSYFLHELGHIVTYTCFRGQQGAATEIYWTRSRRRVNLYYESIGVRRDVCVSLAGPVLGSFPFVPLAIAYSHNVIGLIWAGLILIHLAALLPSQPDGAVVRQALRGRTA